MNQKVSLDESETKELMDCLQVCKDKKALKLRQMLIDKARSTKAMDIIREEAENYTEEGVVEIDDGAIVSMDDSPSANPGGAYVQGWVWVEIPDPEPFDIPGMPFKVLGLSTSKYAHNDALVVLVDLAPVEDLSDIESCSLSANLTDCAIPSDKLAADEFYAKNWSENEHLYAACIERGLIEEIPGRSVRTGFVTAPVCKLTAIGLHWAEVHQMHSK